MIPSAARRSWNNIDKTFTRKVQAIYKTTPKRLMLKLLIRRSLRLLAEESLENVAFHCGYANTRSYSRAFKAVMEHPPTDEMVKNEHSSDDTKA